MKPVRDLVHERIDRVRFVCTDIDDTITHNGKLPAKAYGALWELHNSGIGVIPVTGRPAGWCDLIARQWPVDAVVGENGAFAFYLEDGRLRQLFHPSIAPEKLGRKLKEVRERVLREVPGSRVAKDQQSRMFDLAIDFREEPPDLGLTAARKIAAICEEMGATAKISSIHVNAWFGDYSKVDMIEYYLSKVQGIDPDRQKEVVVYCGDSPNDAPMFERFPLSCGVSNIRPMIDLVNPPPAFVSEGSYADGFVEIAKVLLKLKKADRPSRRS
jgi:HAD superfamily hydrolase (TIGR01484 family)